MFGSAQHAVLLGIDGLAIQHLHDAIDGGYAPNMKALRSRGAFSDDARCNMPSMSLPNWASTLFSAPPEMHGVHTNTFGDAVRPAEIEDGRIWPNVFSIAMHQKPAITTAAFYSWPPLGLLLPRASLNASVLRACGSCDECLKVEPRLLDEYLDALRRRRFGLSWLYFDVLDECGHARGGRSRGFSKLIEQVDGWVGRVVETLRDAGMLEKTMLLVMSDHGREAKGFDHGGFSTGELAVQWLLTGPGVRRGARLRGPISIMDSAPTLLHALGVTPPVQVRGRVVHEAFAQPTPGAWSMRENATAAEMRALLAAEAPKLRKAPPPPPRNPRGGGRRMSGGWDGASVALGAALGILVSGATAYFLARAPFQQRNARGGGATFMRPDEYSDGRLHLHPAARRLRAVAGAPEEDDEEELLVR